jgi:hypothetical protein
MKCTECNADLPLYAYRDWLIEQGWEDVESEEEIEGSIMQGRAWYYTSDSNLYAYNYNTSHDVPLLVHLGELHIGDGIYLYNFIGSDAFTPRDFGYWSPVESWS